MGFEHRLSGLEFARRAAPTMAGQPFVLRETNCLTFLRERPWRSR